MKQRLYTLDAIRGLSVIAMVIFHALWDIIYLFGVKMPVYTERIEAAFGFCIGFTFILVSGFAFGLGKRHLKRALQVLGGAVCVAAVTLVIMPEMPILFGVLTFIGSMMLIMIPLSRLLCRINPYILLSVSALIFIASVNISEGRIGVGALSTELPHGLYSSLFTAYLGFPPMGFMAADYYPLLKWMPLYIAGYSLFLIFKKHSLERILTKVRIPPLEWIGRHALIIYLLHQPLIYALLYLVFI